MKLKMPYRISNYEELITENYYYVDKTKYIEKLENLSDKLEDKQKEAREQIERYSQFEDIKDIEGLRKYTIVVAGNEIFVQEI